MKKILYISAFPPNQKTGGQFYSLNAIKELSQNFLIDILYFSYPGHICEIEKKDNVLSITEVDIMKYDFIKKIWIHPVFTRRFNKSILKRIQSESAKYDILYFDFSQVALYSLYIHHPYKILRIHDVLKQKFGRQNYFMEKWVMSTEKRLLYSFHKVFVPSIKDVNLLKKIYGLNAAYTNEYLKPILFPHIVEQKQQFIFYGYWKRSENTDGLIWFIDKVIPLIKFSSKIIVIGGGLPNEIKERYLKNKGIEYLGFVKNPLDNILESAAVIVPLFQGAGVKVKVIDSFTTGTPVIGTSLAFEGLPDIQGLSYYANNETVFAQIINNFKPFTYKEKINKAKEFDLIYNRHHLLEQI